MEETVKQKVLNLCSAFFAKTELPFAVTVDEKKAKVEKFIAFLKDKTTKTIEKFEELMLIDGTTKVTIEPEVKEGAAIALYDAEGNPIPAPMGEYELSDGRIVVVEQDGMIAMVKEVPAAASADLTATPDPAASAPGIKEMIERIETVSRYNEELKQEFAKYKADTDKKIEHLNKENDTLKTSLFDFQKFQKEAMETLLSEPATTPVVPVPSPFERKEVSGKKEGLFDKFLIKP
jgi:hypothetical protein